MIFNCSYDELVSTHKLVGHPKNPNKHPDNQIDRLAKIIDYQGQRSPVVVCRDTGFIIVGHGRLEAMKKLGWDKVAVNYQTFKDDAQRYAHMTADNAIADWAALDLSQINTDMLDLGQELDLELLGIEDFVLEPIEKLDPGLVDEDDVPEVSDPITKRGDVWLLGDHRVMCGDSTMIDDVEKLMAGEKADMVFTDPPYNVASDSKNYAKDKSKAMNDLANAEWDKDFDVIPPLVNAINSSKDSATYYVWTSQFLIQDIWNTLGEYCNFTSYIVWNKPNPMPSLSKRHPTWNSELCAYGTRGTKRIVNFPKEGHFTSVRTVTKKSDGSHPTQKPLELIEPLIEFSSGVSQLVIDLFLGSGSTLIACQKTNRKCFGMELDEHYCDVIVNRWQNYTGKKAVLESNGKTYDELKGFNV